METTGIATVSALLLEAVWVQGTSPGGLQAVLERFHRWSDVQPPHVRPLTGLVRALENDGVEAFAASILQNRQRLLTRSGGVMKAEVVYRMAQVLEEHGIETPQDVCHHLPDTDLQAALCKIPGVSTTIVARFYGLCEKTTAPEAEPTVPRTPLPKLPEPPLQTEEAEEAEEAIVPETAVLPEPSVPKTRKRTRKPSDVSLPTPESTPETAPVADDEAGEVDVTPKVPVEGYHVRLREMPVDERPRERLIQYGAEAVSVEELLAILLRTGTGKMNAVDLAHHLLTRHGGMRGLATLTVEEMSQIHGIGPAKAAQIKAAIEFGRRLVALNPEERTKLRSPQDVYNLLGPSLRDEKREHFIAILMDTKGGVIRQKTVSIGDLSSSLVHPREVYTEAIRHSAASLIVAHNHPSGDPAPSPDDVAVTRRLIQAGELIGIELLDHIVIGDGRWVSLKEKGMM